MKNIRFIILLMAIAACTWSCTDYSVSEPDACVLVERLNGDMLEAATTFAVGEDVYISSCGDADLYSVWYGDTGSDYTMKDDRETTDDGTVVWTNHGTNLSIAADAHVAHAYSEPGTYTIVLVATNSSMGSTDPELSRKTAEQTITIQ